MPAAYPLTQSIKILIVEDDSTLNNQLDKLLRAKGFETRQCFCGKSGLNTASREHFDLILLDIRLPGLDGFSLLSRLRSKQQTPVMVLSANGAEEERITGYSNGADDYLPKPFNTVELMLRINAILRRTIHHEKTASTSEPCANSLSTHLNASHHPQDSEYSICNLTAVEAKIFSELISATGTVVSKPILYRRALNREFSRYDRGLDMHISRIRRKFKKAGLDSKRIETVHGEGYLFR